MKSIFATNLPLVQWWIHLHNSQSFIMLSDCTRLLLRVQEESQENRDPSALLDLRDHEEKEESWACLGQKETRESWAPQDHL